MTSIFQRILTVTCVAGALLTLAGCSASAETHDDYVNAADQRWRQVRSSMMLQVGQQQALVDPVGTAAAAGA